MDNDPPVRAAKSGAVFPTYDELQLQLVSPLNGKASRETVSRVLLMLRLTSWLLKMIQLVRNGGLHVAAKPSRSEEIVRPGHVAAVKTPEPVRQQAASREYVNGIVATAMSEEQTFRPIPSLKQQALTD